MCHISLSLYTLPLILWFSCNLYLKMPKFSIKISNLKFKQFFKKSKYSRLLEKF